MNSLDDYTPVPSGTTKSNPEKALRDRANERLLAMENQDLESLSADEIRHTLHELHVHQIELEIQNEELRLAQVQLETSRARYLDLYDLAPAGYCTLGENGLILEANLTAATMLDTARGSLISKPISWLILKEDEEIFYLHRKQLIETGIPQVFDLRMVKKDKTVFWARLNATASDDSAGNSVFLIMLSDITEQKQTAEDLRQSEDRFRKLFKQHSAVMLIIDAETGAIVDANEAAAQFYGWTLEELKRMCIQEINTLSPAATKAEMMKAASLKQFRFEFRHRRADGSVRDVEVYSNKIESAGKELLFSVIHDITERKQAEEALREEERYLRTILQTTADGFWTLDDAGNFTQVNEAYCRMLGYTRDELLKLDISDIDAVEDPVMAAAHMQRVITKGSEIFETRQRRKDGSVFSVEISTTYINTGDGKFVTFCRDITERKQAEEQVRALNEDLERKVEQRTRELQETQSQYLHAEKFAAVGKLSASIAHEFNNPLQGIMTILKGLKKRAILEEEDRELLHVAIDESERMKNLIRSLQDFNRPSSGKKVLMDVKKSLDSLLLLSNSDFKSKRISLEIDYAEGLPQILAVPDQIKQVFLNLLNNAADACTRPGGVISISTRQEGEKVAVAIRDTGIGIKPEQMDLLFQPFYSTKPEVKGTGLGLSVCHGIVQSHKGEIRIESEPGKGTTFTVLLPIEGD